MKSHTKTMFDITKELTERTKRRAADNRFNASAIVITQSARRNGTHAMKPANNHRIARRSTSSTAMGANLPLSSVQTSGKLFRHILPHAIQYAQCARRTGSERPAYYCSPE
jgi:hypothetical protein